MGAMPGGVPMLRPLSVGEILDASFKVYGRNFLTMAKAILVVAIPFSLLSAIVRASVSTNSSPGSSGFSTFSTNTTTTASSSAAVASLFVVLLALVSASVSTAIIYRVVGDAYLGQPPSWRVALSGGLRKANSVLWLTLVTVVCFAVLILVPVVLVILAARASVGLGIILGVALGIPAILACIWLAIGAQLATPSLMLEGYKGSKALRRGVALTRHYWWRCLGCLLLVALIVGILSDIVSGVAVVLLLSLAHSDLARTGVYFVSSVLTTVLFSPITASAAGRALDRLESAERGLRHPVARLAIWLATRVGRPELLPAPACHVGKPQSLGQRVPGPIRARPTGDSRAPVLGVSPQPQVGEPSLRPRDLRDGRRQTQVYPRRHFGAWSASAPWPTCPGSARVATTPFEVRPAPGMGSCRSTGAPTPTPSVRILATTTAACAGRPRHARPGLTI